MTVMTEYEARQLVAEVLRRGRSSSGYIPHTATPTQQAFLDFSGLEALYGGAAGGGKSDAMLMGALEHIDKPGYAALLLRRTFKDLSLPGALLDRAREWLSGADVHWSDKEKKFTFPSGAKLVFGYLESEADKYQYQGAEFQYIGFDELTQFSETQYTYLLSRLRRLVGMESIPLKARGASNPGGVGHEWVKRRFVDKDTRGNRKFFPAKLDDNPFIDQETYERSLSELDPITYDQLRRGLWVRDTHGLVYKFNWDANAIEDFPPEDYRSGWTFIHGIDLGSSERKPTTAFCVQAFHPDILAVYTVYSERHQALTPTDIANRWKQLNAAWPAERTVVDVGGLGKGYLGEFQQRHGIPCQEAEKNNKLGYRKLANGDLARGRVLVVAEDNTELLEEFDNLPWNEKGDDNEKGKPCHVSDAWLYSWREARHWLSEEPVEGPARGTQEWYEQQAADMKERHRQRVEESKMTSTQRRRMKRWTLGRSRIIRPV